jgi:hypothetical protein
MVLAGIPVAVGSGGTDGQCREPQACETAADAPLRSAKGRPRWKKHEEKLEKPPYTILAVTVLNLGDTESKVGP